MKNVDFSNILFSMFSPEIIIYPVKNSINPLTSSMKNIIKKKNKEKINIIRSKSAIHSNNGNIIPKRLYKKYIKDISVKNGNKKLSIKYDENSNKNFDYLRKTNLYKYETKTMKNNNPLFSLNNNLMKDFIIIKPKNSKNNYYKKISNKEIKIIEEPYKKYLSEKNKIEFAKRMKELENKYIMESKKQKQLKFENDIRTKFQGIDFFKQRKRESFVEKIMKSKIYKKKEEKKIVDDDLLDKLDTKFFLQMLNYEINEKKYMFLENNRIIPIVKYKAFKERFRIFNWHLKENPNYSELINYISNK